MATLKPEQMVFVPPESVIVNGSLPPGYYNIVHDYWWVESPKKGLLFYKRDSSVRGLGAPMCNANPRVAEQLLYTMAGKDNEYDFRLTFIARAAVPISLRDYR